MGKAAKLMASTDEPTGFQFRVCDLEAKSIFIDPGCLLSPCRLWVAAHEGFCGRTNNQVKLRTAMTKRGLTRAVQQESRHPGTGLTSTGTRTSACWLHWFSETSLLGPGRMQLDAVLVPVQTSPWATSHRLHGPPGLLKLERATFLEGSLASHAGMGKMRLSSTRGPV